MCCLLHGGKDGCDPGWEYPYQAKIMMDFHRKKDDRQHTKAQIKEKGIFVYTHLEWVTSQCLSGSHKGEYDQGKDGVDGKRTHAHTMLGR